MATWVLKINGQEKRIDAEGEMPLLWALRDVVGLTGTKYGCGVGICGACTIHVDGSAARACMMTCKEAQGKQITTIEGLSKDLSHPVQAAWCEQDVAQCGYCQAGQIMAAAALLKTNPNPTDAQIDAAMKDNVCRCGTYQRIRDAIKQAAKEVAK